MSEMTPMRGFTALLFLCVANVSWAAAAAMNPMPGQVVANGAVPDEASRSAIIAKLRELYGPERVVDQLTVGGVVSPPNWTQHMQKILAPNLKLVSRGQLNVDGTSVGVQGEVANEATRQQLASEIATALTPAYTVKNALRVSASEQGVLDQVLANRIVEFDTGSANLTSGGRQILDEMAAAMLRLGGKRVEVVGHTDSSGARAANLALSAARADAVKAYLVTKGLESAMLTTQGAGPDRPIASNDQAEGRARNRRIEFRVAK